MSSTAMLAAIRYYWLSFPEITTASKFYLILVVLIPF